MEKNGLGTRNPSVRLVWYESKFCGNKRPKCEVICPGVGSLVPSVMVVVQVILITWATTQINPGIHLNPRNPGHNPRAIPRTIPRPVSNPGCRIETGGGYTGQLQKNSDTFPRNLLLQQQLRAPLFREPFSRALFASSLRALPLISRPLFASSFHVLGGYWAVTYTGVVGQVRLFKIT